MQVRDDIAWQEQLTELEVDDSARKFKEFLLFWGDAADKIVAESNDSEATANNADSLRRALEIAEQTFGFLSMEWIAQMLVLFVEHWAHGEKLYDELTFIERRLVEQAVAMKIVDLEHQAATMDSSASHTQED